MVDEQPNRQFVRIKTKSILVSLTNPMQAQEITGFLRDISEGGLKIQKLSSKLHAESVQYHCEFFLPELGIVKALVEVVGAGHSDEKFAASLIRLQFIKIDADSQAKVKKFIQSQNR